ncbi:hypothetical protein AB0I61_08930 [Polymorphospora rubra]|uniref:hypothetical protein n=1 Tax=Polymorphospora rubra TaxID=338584 RepID=UPI0033EDBDF6
MRVAGGGSGAVTGGSIPDGSGEERPPEPAAPRRRGLPSPYLVLSTLAVLFSVAVAVRQPWGADFGLHAAVVGRLRDDLWQPANPMVEVISPSPYFTPYTLLLAVIAKVTGLGPATVLSAAGPANLALLLFGLRRFVGLFTTNRWAPVLALLFVPLLWGPAVPQWSGFPALRGLVLILPYPSTLAFGLMLLCWVAVAGALRTASWRRWLVAGLLGGLVILIHPFTAVGTVLGVVAFVVGRLTRLRRPDLVGMLVGAAAALVPVFGWPYFRVTDTLASASELDAIHEALYLDAAGRYGLAFLVGVPALVLRLRRDRLDPLVLLFGLSGAVVLAGWLTGAYAFGRVWPVVVLSLQAAAAVVLATVVAGAFGRRPAEGPAPADPAGVAGPDAAGPPPRRPGSGIRLLVGLWAAVAAVACLAGFATQYGNLLLVLPADQLTAPRRAAHDVTNLPNFGWVDRAVAPGSVVLTGNAPAGRALLAFEIRSVAPPWPDPLLADEDRRLAEQAELVDAATPDPRRRALLTAYGVDWILDLDGSYGWADGYASTVVEGPGKSRLLKVAQPR